MGEWGGPGSADFNGSGTVDGADLGILLGAWGSCPTCPATTVIGLVLFEDGSPLSGAVIVTDLGGQGVSVEDGTFAFEVAVPEGVSTLYATAVAEVNGVTYMGTSGEAVVNLGAETPVGAITVSGGEMPTCDELAWVPTFAGDQGLNGVVRAFTVFDDRLGGGPALYAGGDFTTAGGVTVNGIAKWNGFAWSSLGSGTGTTVLALTAFNDGSSGDPALYAGGGFVSPDGDSYLAKWGCAETSDMTSQP